MAAASGSLDRRACSEPKECDQQNVIQKNEYDESERDGLNGYGGNSVDRSELAVDDPRLAPHLCGRPTGEDGEKP